MHIAYTFNQIKQAFINLYGDSIYNQDFDSFDEAFQAALESFDFITNAESLEDFCQGVAECWQLTEG